MSGGGEKNISNKVYVTGQINYGTVASAGLSTEGTLVELDNYKQYTKVKPTIVYNQGGANIGTAYISACDDVNYLSNSTEEVQLPFNTETDISSILSSGKKYLRPAITLASLGGINSNTTIQFEFS